MMGDALREIRGCALPLEGNGLDTDRIIPARFLRVLTFDGLGQHVFEDDRKQAKQAGTCHPFDDACYGGASILLVGDNFGCGSSREHAPQALYLWGIRAIIGISFGDIFRGNSVALGLPCAQAGRDIIKGFWEQCRRFPNEEFLLDIEQQTLHLDDQDYPVHFEVGDRQRFLGGTWDPLKTLLSAQEDIQKTANSLPYMKNFSL